MTCCPWLKEHGFTCAGASRFVDEHVIPCVTTAFEKTDIAVQDLREEVRERPIRALAIAGLAGLILGVSIAAARR
ncbi:hypothetical protein [Acidisoma silvae]|uniref:DUF883 domain-containing protein n=1 Tax=Acidisoma silvae TaxID=2802396 RepID=A0A963YNK5_9PROT|nr:hypothetical protein [Acidisoma silvae]MCB8874198.1 hypothetical protein [Acidisoma silvae]